MAGPNSISACAIIVTYNPDATVLGNLLGKINTECDFFVIDNKSDNLHEFESGTKAHARCIGLEKLDENQGLATAINIGLQEALGRNYSHAFLFDQDSDICELFFHKMARAWSEANELLESKLIALGPRVENPSNGRRTKFKLFDRLWFRSDRPIVGKGSHYYADFLISSGTMIALNLLERVGLMKENYFIDNVDLEWCFRAKARGLSLAGTDEATLYHSIGVKSESRLVKMGIMVHHGPSRAYYITRNRFNLYRQSYSPAGWKFRDRIRFVLKSLWLVLFSNERREYWDSIVRGIRDSRNLDSNGL